MALNKMSSLILASQSPRRLELLAQIGIVPTKVVPADIDENCIPLELPSECAQRLSLEKAKKVAKDYPDYYILAADTIVACGRRMLGKAASRAEAFEFLSLLSGRRHRVYGGICLLSPNGAFQRVKLSQSIVKFKVLSSQEKNDYLDQSHWQDKAGAYAIQDKAASLIDFISGSYSNIVGLDLYVVRQLLKGLGFKSEGFL